MRSVATGRFSHRPQILVSQTVSMTWGFGHVQVRAQVLRRWVMVASVGRRVVVIV